MTVKVEVVLGELWRAARRVEQHAQTPSLAPAAYFAFFPLRFYTLIQHCDLVCKAYLHVIRDVYFTLPSMLQLVDAMRFTCNIELASSPSTKLCQQTT
jgi:hypothetical protein